MRAGANQLLTFLNAEPEREERHDHRLLRQLAELIAADKPELSGQDAKLITEAGKRMSEAARLRIGITWSTVRHGGRARDIVAPDLWLNPWGQHLKPPITERAARAYVELWVALAQRYGRVMPKRGEHRWLMRVFAAPGRSLLRRCEVCNTFFLGERTSATYCSARCRKRSFLAQRPARSRRPDPRRR